MRLTILLSCACVVGCTSSNPLAVGGDAAVTDQSIESTAMHDDLAKPDLTIPPDLSPPPNPVGMPCPNGDECPMGFTCISQKDNYALPPAGFCTHSCNNDGDCGMDAFCGPSIGAAGQLCFHDCDANGQCADASHVCTRRLNGTLDLVKTACLPGNPMAMDGDPCSTFADCNRDQTCFNNLFESPDGSCLTIGCTPGDSTTCAPGGMPVCLTIAAGVNACLPGCTMTSDCRVMDGYACEPSSQMPGAADVCVYPHNSAGAACTKDTDCGPPDSPWRCLSTPGGYCTGYDCDPGDARTCPSNTHCVPVNGNSLCLKDCTTDADCRQAEGYKCVPVDPKQPGGATVCGL